MNRRELLERAGAAALVAALPLGCGDDEIPATADASASPDATPTPDEGEPPEPLPEYEHEGEPGPETLFGHGVASGDPLTDAVILWTRVTPDQEGPVEVWWEIARDPDFVARVAVGTVTTDASRDYTVKVDATGLEPATTWYYRFFALGRESVTGRSRTAPDAGDGTVDTDRLRFAVMSCSNLTIGFFHAYRDVAERSDLDAVIHLGDYFYEYARQGFVPERTHQPPRETVVLADYRERFAQYRTDPDLLEAHRQHPWITVWDDHESANDSSAFGAGNHQPGEGDWETRKADARQAYLEWMPVRAEDPERIFRTVRYGDLMDLIMLDTRLFGRDLQTKDEAEMKDPDRTLLGAEQEAWLEGELAASTATWRVLGQQVMLAPLTAAGTVINPDQWDGYQAARQRLIDAIDANAGGDVVALTGDIHSSWASEVTREGETYDPEVGGALVEFVTPGVTSGFPLDETLVSFARDFNPHVKYGEVTSRGYMLLDVDSARVQAEWHHFDDVQAPYAPPRLGGAYATAAGTHRITEAEASRANPNRTAPPAP